MTPCRMLLDVSLSPKEKRIPKTSHFNQIDVFRQVGAAMVVIVW